MSNRGCVALLEQAKRLELPYVAIFRHFEIVSPIRPASGKVLGGFYARLPTVAGKYGTEHYLGKSTEEVAEKLKSLAAAMDVKPQQSTPEKEHGSPKRSTQPHARRHRAKSTVAPRA